MNTMRSDFSEIGKLTIRVGVGFMMLSHGTPKLMGLFSGGDITFPDPLGLGMVLTFVMAVFSEFFCSLLIILGLKIRYAVIPLALTMFVAGFIHHFSDPWQKKELAVLYLIVYVALFYLDSGKFSLDYYLSKRKSQ